MAAFKKSPPKKSQTSQIFSLPGGVYRHYKGGHYLVLGVARHSETEEPLVVYVRLYARTGCPLWVRPLANFTSKTLNAAGKCVQRFKYVGPEEKGS
jgi:hypothetical protein